MTRTTNFFVQADAAKRAHDALIAGMRNAGFTVHEYSDVDAEIVHGPDMTYVHPDGGVTVASWK